MFSLNEFISLFIISSFLNFFLVNSILQENRLKFVTRSEWDAILPKHELTELILPVKKVMIGTTQTQNCYESVECGLQVKNIQLYHMEVKHWDDIGYNFLIGGDGSIFLGRSWAKEGAHAKEYNNQSLDIAFIGTFKNEKPSKEQIDGLTQLLNYGVLNKKVNQDFKFYTQQDLILTDYPFENDVIKNVPDYGDSHKRFPNSDSSGDNIKANITDVTVRNIQTYHMMFKNWSDIAYNFLIGGDGNVYEGRAWDYAGAHTKGYNQGAIDIAFIGSFSIEAPPEKQLNAGLLLIEEGVQLGKIDPNYHVYGQRLFANTESPGSALYDIIKVWPHFSEKIE